MRYTILTFVLIGLILAITSCTGSKGVSTSGREEVTIPQSDLTWSVVKSPGGHCYEMATAYTGGNWGVMSLGAEVSCDSRY